MRSRWKGRRREATVVVRAVVSEPSVEPSTRLGYCAVAKPRVIRQPEQPTLRGFVSRGFLSRMEYVKSPPAGQGRNQSVPDLRQKKRPLTGPPFSKRRIGRNSEKFCLAPFGGFPATATRDVENNLER